MILPMWLCSGIQTGEAHVIDDQVWGHKPFSFTVGAAKMMSSCDKWWRFSMSLMNHCIRGALKPESTNVSKSEENFFISELDVIH